jgi:SAM-dependent methyltransferase
MAAIREILSAFRPNARAEAWSRLPGGSMRTDGPYAPPREVTALEDCYFYHTMEVPSHGLVEGEWDLREGIDAYLGGVELRGKRVLDLGTASGFVCFHAERRGAEVVAYDLSDRDSWDVVPFAGFDRAGFAEGWRRHIRRLNDGFWLTHRAVASRARVCYGSVYSVSPAIGPVDVAIFGSILLHLRDPFLALESALRLVRETVVIVEVPPPWMQRLARCRLPVRWLARLGRPRMEFLPEPGRHRPETWWRLHPEAAARFVAVLGFEDARVTFHSQRYLGRPIVLYTLVGHRTRGGPAAEGRAP